MGSSVNRWDNAYTAKMADRRVGFGKGKPKKITPNEISRRHVIKNVSQAKRLIDGLRNCGNRHELKKYGEFLGKQQLTDSVKRRLREIYRSKWSKLRK